MRQSQSSVLPEIADKGKRPAGPPWLTGATGLLGVAVVAASIQAHQPALAKVRGS